LAFASPHIPIPEWFIVSLGVEYNHLPGNGKPDAWRMLFRGHSPSGNLHPHAFMALDANRASSATYRNNPVVGISL